MKMDFELLKKLGAADIVILVVFIVYIVFPVSTPHFLVPVVDSPIGMTVMSPVCAPANNMDSLPEDYLVERHANMAISARLGNG